MPKFISLRTFKSVDDADTSAESTIGNQPETPTSAHLQYNAQPAIPARPHPSRPQVQHTPADRTIRKTFTRISTLETAPLPVNSAQTPKTVPAPAQPVMDATPAPQDGSLRTRSRQVTESLDEAQPEGTFSLIRKAQNNARQAGRSIIARARHSYAGILAGAAPQAPVVETEPLKLPDQIQLPGSLIPQPLPLPGKPLRPPMSEEALKLRRTLRPPLAIHANMQRIPHASTLEPGKGIPDRTRSTLVLTAVGLLFLVTFFSLVPVNSGQSALAIFTNSIGWSHPQVAGTLDVAIPAQQATPTPALQVPAAATTSATTLNNTPPPIVLSKSQYVAVAQQAAASAGIPPAAFVRQIQAESGFNPNAVSPGGLSASLSLCLRRLPGWASIPMILSRLSMVQLNIWLGSLTVSGVTMPKGLLPTMLVAVLYRLLSMRVELTGSLT